MPRRHRSGLYSLQIRMLDATIPATRSHVLHDGTIPGGDAHFDCRVYSSAQGRWKGELINHTHTPTMGQRPVVRRCEVGIGFPALQRGQAPEPKATALAAAQHPLQGVAQAG